MICDINSYINSEKIIHVLDVLIREALYNPLSILNGLDVHKNNINDPNIPNLDKALRRKLHKKSVEIVKIFRFFETYQNEIMNEYARLYPKRWLEIFKKIHDVYIYQLEPELIELRIKYSHEEDIDIEYHESRHLSRYISILHDSYSCSKNNDFYHVHDIPMNPTFETTTIHDNIYSYQHQRYNFKKRDKHVVVRKSDDDITTRFGMYHNNSTNSHMLSRVIFSHSEIDYLFTEIFMPMFSKIKSNQNKVLYFIKYNSKILHKLPREVINIILGMV